MENMKRTATCGELNSSRVGETVTLNGWVHRNRDHGGILFINLRDRYGITQVVIDEDASAPLKEKAKELKFEYCIAVVGIVRRRPDEMVNKDMNTGEIEVAASQIEILTKCDVLPFMIDEKSDAKEDLRLKYRYLDLRSFSMQRKIRLRTDVTFAAREFLIGKGFMEIETPTMIKSTPEGARDFLVPSRIHAGKFYALPQSPQLYKQILMVSGFDRYFQIAHCFRDEDARGDRQPEHTQIDMEMSFVSKDDVFEVVEGMMSYIFDKTLGVKLETPFQRLPYDDALNRFGSDKPDLRFGLEMKTVDELASKSGFNAFKSVVAEGGCVKALVASGCSGYSRKQISELEDAAKVYGAKGLAWMKVGESGIEGGVSKFFDGIAEELLTSLGAQHGDLILMVGDKWNVACTSLGAVRSKLGKDLGLIEAGTFRFCWIVDFPLFEYNEEEQRWEAAHHMFTMPQEQYLDTLEENPGAVKGDLYDLVCNGFELASGSIRIHDPEIQKRIFNIVGFSSEEAENRFGFLLNAFRYGPPPHGGIAPGLDRLVMIMAGENSIKEVIAFPKNNQAYSPMDDSPSLVDEDQLKMLHIKLDMPEKEEES
ncbi:aspartate--tRNA ligase [Sediminispirochaeta bajacaliforniensis]|uniref:aspartate--tRNA ligase n=1 Tax=Sediminispirochaeta bajacaliforniensis TaxID=148 RepID=UPI00036ADBC2|nr:aspartate--tRNA ligase [Sediminispirochaeta bajacaliforniensis]